MRGILRRTGFVRWSSLQIEVYAEMFRRQVFGVDQDGKVVQESLAVTRAHAAMVSASFYSQMSQFKADVFDMQLKDVGLDFGFLLDSLLRPSGELRRRRSMGDQKLIKAGGAGSSSQPALTRNKSLQR